MALHLRPVGPLPGGTYWLRRGLLAAVVVVLLVVLRGCTGDDAADDRLSAGSPSPAGASPETPVVAGPLPTALPTDPVTPTELAPTEPVAKGPVPANGTVPGATAPDGPVTTASTVRSPPAAAPCADSTTSVRTSTGAPRHPAGTAIALSLTLRNDGPLPCVREIGPGAVALRVLSGADRIWSSDDCTAGVPRESVTLAPGASRTTTVTWPGVRSRPGCTGDGERIRPGTYRLIGRVGEVESVASVFLVTGG